MNDFIKFTGPADVLAFIPHTLGQTPTESFVALTMQGNKIGATLRVDAPFGQDPVGYAQTIVSYLTADEAATGSLLVIYTDESTTDGSSPYAGHVEALRSELETAGMPLQDAWLVTSELWRNYLCTDTSCCPDESLDTVTTSNGNAALIYRGSAVTGFIEPAPFTGDKKAREAITAHKPDGWPEDLEASRAAWAKVLDDPKSLTTQTAHQLAGALQHPTIRDYMMGDIVPHAPEQFTSVMLGVFLTRPDWARVDTAQEVAFELMKATPFRCIPSHGSYFECYGYGHFSDEADKDLAIRLTREYGIATIPMSAFYKHGEDNKVLRFCFAKKEETLKKAVEKLSGLQ